MSSLLVIVHSLTCRICANAQLLFSRSAREKLPAFFLRKVSDIHVIIDQGGSRMSIVLERRRIGMNTLAKKRQTSVRLDKWYHVLKSGPVFP